MRQQSKLGLRIAVGLVVGVITLGLSIAEATPVGYTAGLELTSAACANTTTEQSATDHETHMGLFDCASAGLEVSPGESFSVVLTGFADPYGSGSIGMEVTSGDTVDHIECSNATTGQSIEVTPDIDFAGWFDCSEAGLEAGPDETVSITVGGVAP